MKERHLSDNVSRLIRDAEQRQDLALGSLDAALLASRDATDSLAAARAAKSWWKRKLTITTRDERIATELVEHHREAIVERSKRVEHAGIKQAQATRGKEGETVVPRRLGSRLSDQWTMIHGCRNSKGEIDHVLVGPGGVWAIEVKAKRVLLDIYGDEWRFQKIDKWGNSFERGKATDRSGRSWGQQVAEPAEVLARRLKDRGHDVSIQTAVVLVMPPSSVLRAVKPGVDLVTADLDELERRVLAGGVTNLDRKQVDDIDQVIVEHHRDHKQGKSRSAR